jgi:hypothetical protein
MRIATTNANSPDNSSKITIHLPLYKLFKTLIFQVNNLTYTQHQDTEQKTNFSIAGNTNHNRGRHSKNL